MRVKRGQMSFSGVSMSRPCLLPAAGIGIGIDIGIGIGIGIVLGIVIGIEGIG